MWNFSLHPWKLHYKLQVRGILLDLQIMSSLPNIMSSSRNIADNFWGAVWGVRFVHPIQNDWHKLSFSAQSLLFFYNDLEGLSTKKT